MQISRGDKPLLCPSKWVQRGQNKMASHFTFTIQAALSHGMLLKRQNFGNIRHYANDAILTSQREAVQDGTNAGERNVWIERGRKQLTFSYFPFVCLRKDVIGRERETQAMLELPHPAYYRPARLSVLKPFCTSLFELHLSFAVQSFLLLCSAYRDC